jgi:DNA repair protein RadC
MKTAQQTAKKTNPKRDELIQLSNALKPYVENGTYTHVNAALIAYYTDEENTTFHTFWDWKKLNQSVKKGAKGYAIWGRPVDAQKKAQTPTGEEEEYEFFPICYLFSNSQVEPSKTPYKEIPPHAEEPKPKFKKGNPAQLHLFQEPKPVYGYKLKKALSYELEKSPKLAEVKAQYIPVQTFAEMPLIENSQNVFDYLRPVLNNKIYHVEYFLVMFLNRANKVLGWSKISKGGIAGTLADAKVIFQLALLRNASSIIIAHNHPSGNIKPSVSDITLTEKMKKAGEIVTIPVLEHVILTDTEYYSFADNGLI